MLNSKEKKALYISKFHRIKPRVRKKIEKIVTQKTAKKKGENKYDSEKAKNQTKIQQPIDNGKQNEVAIKHEIHNCGVQKRENSSNAKDVVCHCIIFNDSRFFYIVDAFLQH